MKKLLLTLAAMLAAGTLVCHAQAATTVKVGASPTPHAEILNAAKDMLKAEGINLEIIEYSDYVQPNVALDSKDLDANYFQHKPYLDDFNAQKGTKLSSMGGVHYEPFGIYSSKYESLDDLPENATVCIPNDPSNQTRALFLLQDAGLLTLPEGSTPLDTLNVTDVVEVKNGLQISDIDAAQLPSTLEDKDIVVINGNYALDAGLSPLNDAIFYEPADGEAASIYANYVCVRAEDVDADWVKALQSCLCSEKTYEFMTENEAYAGGVIPFFSLDSADEE